LELNYAGAVGFFQTRRKIMMKFVLAVGVVALLGTSAMAQSSQGQGAGQAGVNGNASTTNDSGMANPSMRNSTTGMSTGATAGSSPQRGSPNGSPATPPKATTGPNGMPSNNESPPK
jgi:hypothetical protein